MKASSDWNRREIGVSPGRTRLDRNSHRAKLAMVR